MKRHNQRLCMYCGNPAGKVRKGEHLFPAAIGGTLRTKDVCQTCNNGVLSDIDRELCSRSPLSLVAAKEIGAHISQAWDVDDYGGNLFLEGRPDFARGSFKLYPQMIVMPVGEQFRTDFREVQEFGIEKFHVLFSRRLRKAFWEHEHGDKDAIRFSRIQHNAEILKERPKNNFRILSEMIT